MQREDWEPTPGRFLVLLPLPAGQGDGRDAQHKAAEAAQERLEALAAVFQRERRLLFRTVPISDTLAKLLPAAADAAAANGSSGGGGDSGSSKDAAEGSNGAAPAAEKQPAAAAQPAALVLHPRRGRFQALPLGHMQSAVLRLEDLLDGYGEWREAAPS